MAGLAASLLAAAGLYAVLKNPTHRAGTPRPPAPPPVPAATPPPSPPLQPTIPAAISVRTAPARPAAVASAVRNNTRITRSAARPATEPGREEAASDKKILVSFDAGSSDRGAGEILDALRGRSIRTTVFLTGQFIRRYPELARRIAEDGHEVGNHTWDHPHLTTYALDGRQRTRAGVTEAMLRRELDDTAALYRETTGREMARLWRAPFGEENREILGWAEADGYRHVSWTHGDGRNLDALDWVTDPESPRYRTSERVISRLLASARPGNIILMHLGSEREDPVADHLPRLLDTLASEGYRFATASDLIASGTFAR